MSGNSPKIDANNQRFSVKYKDFELWMEKMDNKA